MQYAICFGLVLPVNSPQGMVAYGTDTFDVKNIYDYRHSIDYYWLCNDARICPYILALDWHSLKVTNKASESYNFLLTEIVGFFLTG